MKLTLTALVLRIQMCNNNVIRVEQQFREIQTNQLIYNEQSMPFLIRMHRCDKEQGQET